MKKNEIIKKLKTKQRFENQKNQKNQENQDQ